MRTGPFSSTDVIERLNARFVPVYTVNEDHADHGPAPAEDKRLVRRIYRDALASGQSAGTVHVYVLAPDGQFFASLHVAEAAKTPNLLALLDRAARQFDVAPGQPAFGPKPQSAPPPAPPGALTLHLTARPLSGGGSWDGISENWIVYTPTEARGWLAAPPEPALVERLLRHVYPVTENNDPAKNKIERQELTATTIAPGLARLDGKLTMAHWFYHRPDDKIVEATLTGYVAFERDRVRALRLVTQKATYGGGTFGVAVRSV